MRPAPRILVVDDEPAIADAVVYALKTEGMEARHTLLGGEALEILRQGATDLVVLDVGLPDMSGFDVCRAARQFSNVPIIFLTARGGEIDTIVGLELGADDYIAKPFSPRELTARVRVVLRRAPAASSPGASPSPGLELDAAAGWARYQGTRLELTRYELGLLDALVAARGRILSRTQLMDRVWGDATESFDRTVDAHIKTLRAKLRAVAPDRELIRTHRGMGYAYDEEG